MNKQILFIVPYPFDKAPSQRLKFEQYYPLLKKQGYNITCKAFFGTKFWQIVYQPGHIIQKVFYTFISYLKRYLLLFSLNKYDVIYVHLWGTPFGLPVYEWLLRQFSKKIVYDIDDLVYKTDSSKNNALSSLLKTAAKINYLLKKSNYVLVSTEKLYQYAKQFNINIALIPATINTDGYTQDNPKSDEFITIGWSGSQTTSKYLHLLDDVLKELSQYKNVKITVMGDPNFKLDGAAISIENWSSETEISSLMKFDIGLHPLPDEEWVYGKSGGKLVQYMAAGIPIVASAIGPNFIAVTEGYNGFLVKNDKEWIEKLTLLVANRDLRKQMGMNSKKMADEVYSVKANISRYLEVFDNL